MRVLGIDLGKARIGVAVGDTTIGVATASEVLPAVKGPQLASALQRCIDDWEAEKVIVGLPRSLNGDEGPAAIEIRAQVDALAQRLSVPVTLHDERFSTVSAQGALHEAGVSSKKGRKIIDAVAAAVILQNWLDAQPRVER